MQGELEARLGAPGRHDASSYAVALPGGQAATVTQAFALHPALPEGPAVAVPLTRASGVSLRCWSAAKRAIDVTAALLGLVVLAPLLAVLALAIRIDTRGPVLYRQRRVGRDGTTFEMLKFRTMVVDAHLMRDVIAHLNEAAPGLFKIADDPRMTAVGRVLRRSCVDELPQLWNVLRGHMSLVGPRPLVPEEDSLIGGWYRRRLCVRPGMTGAWQVTGDHSLSLLEMAAIDLHYVERWSPAADARVLASTVAHVFTLRGK